MGQTDGRQREGCFFLYKTFHPRPMKRAGGGSIINLSSIYGIVGAGDLPPYHASRGRDSADDEERCLVLRRRQDPGELIHPGFIWTPMVENFAAEQGDA